ncbi:hypothetical protein ACP3V3_02750 [Vibrio sp. PNB22_3_1]
MRKLILFDNTDALYNSLDEANIDEFWASYNSVYIHGHSLHVDTSDMSVDDKIEIAWRMLCTYPFLEKRLCKL